MRVLSATTLLLLSAPRLFSALGTAGSLYNPDFEAPSPVEGWQLNIYGARPELTADRAIRHEGAQSLRISAGDSSDTALGQEISLEPNKWYRLTGWVKTQKLEPQNAAVYGTFQVQNSGGRGIIASGANHRGDTDWTEVPVIFEAPPDGRVRVCLFFAGFGKGIGTGWFDDVKLEPIDLGACTIRITRASLGRDEIAPGQYGQFIEYLCNLVPGMWAEKLYDGSFEGLSPYQFQFIKEKDFKEKPWYPSGEVNRATYSLDHTSKISGNVSKKIEAEPGAPCSVGLSQDGIFVEKSEPCDFSCWFRSEGLPGPVRVTLHHGLLVYDQCEFHPGSAWEKFSARLNPNAREDNATLSIQFRGPGALWVDNASLMPVHTIHGWRPDVVEAVRGLKPGVIRFGGSAVDEPSMGDFEWKDTIGDPDRRRPFRAWGGLQPTGPGLEEIVQFCQLIGAEPLMCVRFTGREPKDAAQEIEYFNGATNTSMGAWRARNGHPEPYRIKYWQVGNERGGQEYESRLRAFCETMKAADPSIQLFSSFPTPGLIKEAGRWLDFVCPHHYSHDLNWMESDLGNVERLIRENAPGRAMHIAVTEWNTTAGDAGPRRAMLWTLANALACSRYHNLLHRHAGSVKIANRSNLINSFCSGIVQTDNHRLYKTPTYYAQQLYATLSGNLSLIIESSMPANVGPDLSATLSADGRTVTLFAVNDSLNPISRPVDFSAFGSKPQQVSVWTLIDHKHADEPDVTNSFDAPERVSPERSAFRARGGNFTYAFPALSLTVLRWEVDQRRGN